MGLRPLRPCFPYCWTGGRVGPTRKGGRRDPEEITIYKSLGITTQDLAAARLALAEARRRGLGREVEL